MEIFDGNGVPSAKNENLSCTLPALSGFGFVFHCFSRKRHGIIEGRKSFPIREME